MTFSLSGKNHPLLDAALLEVPKAKCALCDKQMTLLPDRMTGHLACHGIGIREYLQRYHGNTSDIRKLQRSKRFMKTKALLAARDTRKFNCPWCIR